MVSIALNFIVSDIEAKRNCSILDYNPQQLLRLLELPLVYFAARNDPFCPLLLARKMFDSCSSTLH